MSGEDVIIGKTTPLSQDDAQGQSARYTRRDHSISLRHSETGIVDQVSFTVVITYLKLCLYYERLTSVSGVQGLVNYILKLNPEWGEKNDICNLSWSILVT